MGNIFQNFYQKISNNNDHEQRKIVIQTLIDKTHIAKGEKQQIRIELFDADSDDKIKNATISGQILDSSKKIIKKFAMKMRKVLLLLAL